jgi:hypothetical protein
LHKNSKIFFRVFVIALVLADGCGLFDTRDPEPPDNTRSTYVPPTTPQIVLDNLSFSILEKNTDNYTKCISAANYTYVPDAQSLSVWGTLFLSWNQQSEKRYFETLIAATNTTASSVLFLDNERFTIVSSDSVLFQASYIVVFQHNRINLPKSAKGNMNLTLNTDANDLYYISRWEDFRQNDTDFTWSELKANFSP